MANTWNPGNYNTHAHYVAQLGAPVLDLLAVQPNESILDLGCGDGSLSKQIMEKGAKVIGVDASEEMVQASKANGINAVVQNASELSFNHEFDAVFSNAAIHWMLDIDSVLKGVKRSLKPRGRFVGEFGGFGNIAAISTALFAHFSPEGLSTRQILPWYFPTPSEFQNKLETYGFRVEEIMLIPRPTPLPSDMAGWLVTFTQYLRNHLNETKYNELIEKTITNLKPILCDQSGHWSADYVRLRFHAQLND